MNIHYLKKIRKKYNTIYKSDGIVIVDQKRKTASNLKSIAKFISEFVYDNIGLASYCDYITKLANRQTKREARLRYQKLVENTSNKIVSIPKNIHFES